jgi:hypothetical protein
VLRQLGIDGSVVGLQTTCLEKLTAIFCSADRAYEALLRLQKASSQLDGRRKWIVDGGFNVFAQAVRYPIPDLGRLAADRENVEVDSTEAIVRSELMSVHRSRFFAAFKIYWWAPSSSWTKKALKPLEECQRKEAVDDLELTPSLAPTKTFSWSTLARSLSHPRESASGFESTNAVNPFSALMSDSSSENASHCNTEEDNDDEGARNRISEITIVNSWTCSVCTFENSPNSAQTNCCSMCGSAARLADPVEPAIECRVCTYLNHASKYSGFCEMCDTELSQ